MLNSINIMGRLTADPEERTVGDASVVSIRIACERDYLKDGERPVDFITITAWNKTGGFVKNYFKKGDLIAVEGRLECNSYQKDGETRYSYQIKADSVYFTGSKKDAEKNHNGDSSASDDFSSAKFPGE